MSVASIQLGTDHSNLLYNATDLLLLYDAKGFRSSLAISHFVISQESSY
jgi:hypothetical protein